MKSTLWVVFSIEHPRSGRGRSASIATGETHGNQFVTTLLSELKSKAMLLADRGYDAGWIAPLPISSTRCGR
jgi:hypothetical protein